MNCQRLLVYQIKSQLIAQRWVVFQSLIHASKHVLVNQEKLHAILIVENRLTILPSLRNILAVWMSVILKLI